MSTKTDRRFLDVRLTVDGIVTAVPEGTIPEGAQYLIGAKNAAGAFAGHENQIAKYDGTKWRFFRGNSEGLEVFNLADFAFYRFELDSTEEPAVYKWVRYKDDTAEQVNDQLDTRILKAVLAVGEAGDVADKPVSPALNDLYIAVDEGKVYTATGEGVWNDGVVPAEGARYASSSDTKIYTFDGTQFVEEEVPDGAIFVSKRDDNVYAHDGDNSRFINLTDTASRPEFLRHIITTTHTLTAQEVTDKEFDLAKLAYLPHGVLLSVGGLVHVPNVDYNVTNANGTSTLSWDGLGLEDNDLEEGDVFVLTYATEVQD